jgi:two-component system, sensor histidine kinase PdtaS
MLRLVESFSHRGNQPDGASIPKHGLGTSIVNALAQQLDAEAEIENGKTGMTISIAHTEIRR